MNLDTQLFLFLNGLAGQSPFLDGSIVFFSSYLAFVVPLMFLVFLAVAPYSGQEKWRIFLVTAVSSIVARFGIAELIRFFIHRPRPFSVLPIHPLFTDNSWSFPSGHATFFFALAAAVYFYDKKWGIAFFVAAFLISVGRVIAGVHYPSDIIVGALLGAAVAYGTYLLARKSAPTGVNQTY